MDMGSIKRLLDVGLKNPGSDKESSGVARSLCEKNPSGQAEVPFFFFIWEN